MSKEVKGLPVPGYKPTQSQEAIQAVTKIKHAEERVLRLIDELVEDEDEVISPDTRWLSIARTHFQEGFMAASRAVFQPERIDDLPEDAEEIDPEEDNEDPED
jgi:hypothetical protein